MCSNIVPLFGSNGFSPPLRLRLSKHFPAFFESVGSGVFDSLVGEKKAKKARKSGMF
jgi:hypothetical protein